MRANLTGSDKLNGGAGNDTVTLNGDYSAGVTLGAGELQSIETVSLSDGHSYKLTLGGGDVAAGKTLTIDGSALRGSNTLTIDGSAETTGSLTLIGGAGIDRLTGGAGNDTFFAGPQSIGYIDYIYGGGGNDTIVVSGNYADSDIVPISGSESYVYELAGTLDVHGVAYAQFADQTVQIGTLTTYGTPGNDSLSGSSGDDIFNFSQGGDDVVGGGGGDDTLIAGVALTANDKIDGGDGTDILTLSGNYSGARALNLGAVQNVETITLGTGFNYALTSTDATVAAGSGLWVDGSALGVGNSMTFNGAAETDGNFTFVGGAGLDILTGGAGGAGNDTFIMGAKLTTADRINGGSGSDYLYLNGDYSGGLTLGATTITGVGAISLTGATATISPPTMRRSRRGSP